MRHFIQQHDSDSTSTIHDPEKAAEDGATGVETAQRVVIDSATATTELVHRIRGVSYLSRYRISANIDPNSIVEERRELQRISTCAIFHKFTRGAGVPHTFVGFIRQWPALPRVVASTVIFQYPTVLIRCLGIPFRQCGPRCPSVGWRSLRREKGQINRR